MRYSLPTSSDHSEPFRIVSKVIGKRILLAHPDIPQYDKSGNSIHREPSKILLKHVAGVKKFRLPLLHSCQFPDKITDKHGTIHRPAPWSGDGDAT